MTSDFSRRHYIALAHIIAHSLTIDELTANLILYLRCDNYNFDPTRFVEAISRNRKQTIQQVVPA